MISRTCILLCMICSRSEDPFLPGIMVCRSSKQHGQPCFCVCGSASAVGLVRLSNMWGYMLSGEVAKAHTSHQAQSTQQLQSTLYTQLRSSAPTPILLSASRFHLLLVAPRTRSRSRPRRARFRTSRTSRALRLRLGTFRRSRTRRRLPLPRGSRARCS